MKSIDQKISVEKMPMGEEEEEETNMGAIFVSQWSKHTLGKWLPVVIARLYSRPYQSSEYIYGTVRNALWYPNSNFLEVCSAVATE